MSATPRTTVSWCPNNLATQLPVGAQPLLAANAQVGQGQLVTFDASGNVALNDGTVPGLIAAGNGFPGKLSATSAQAGAASVSLYYGFGPMPFSTAVGDGFTAADAGGVPAFIASEGTIGRKSNLSGNNRSIAGMVYGVTDDGLASFWGGPQAQAAARSLLTLNAYPLASAGIADAAANTATAEKSIRRPAVKGTISSIYFNGAAVVADNTDYVTITVSKRDGAGGGAVSLGTYDSRAANQGAVTAFVNAPFLLSVVAGALYLLETDIVTITVVKGGAGKVLTGEFYVNGKAI